ncbi:MAG: hypothetical protein K0S41_768 [Anaerocolumna sp.]|jgi:hypothetical protein|nr:hypothetical protein [Anaerocolumna sp.]
MQKLTTEFESQNNMLHRINQLKHELNNKISYYNGNISNDEIVSISRSLDMLIIEYHEGRISN